MRINTPLLTLSNFYLLIALLFLISTTSCKNPEEEHQKGYELGLIEGHQNGFSEGEKKGNEEGYAKGLAEGTEAGFNNANIDTYKKLLEVKGSIDFQDVSFSPELDYEAIVGAIMNPSQRATASPEFSQAVKQVNLTIIDHMAKRIGLSPEESRTVKREYSQAHPSIAQSYFKHYQSLQDGDENLGNSQIVSTKYYQSADNFSRVIGERLCGTVSFLTDGMAMGAYKHTAKELFLADPCAWLLSETVDPLVNYLEKQGAIKDLYESETSIKNHLRQQIAELATVKDKFNVNKRQTFIKEIDYFPDSKATLDFDLQATVKAGFDLGKYLAIEVIPHQQKIVVSLPPAEILSFETRDNIKEIDQGLLKKIGPSEINMAKRQAEEELYNKALRSGILSKAQSGAERIIWMLFQPILTSNQLNYEIEVDFARDKTVNNSKD